MFIGCLNILVNLEQLNLVWLWSIVFNTHNVLERVNFLCLIRGVTWHPRVLTYLPRGVSDTPQRPLFNSIDLSLPPPDCSRWRLALIAQMRSGKRVGCTHITQQHVYRRVTRCPGV